MIDQEVRTAVRHARCELADRIESLTPEQWDSDSWCRGWRVRDVLGHLVHMAEANNASMFALLSRNPVRPDRALDREARRLGDRPVPELASRLRAADGRFHVIGSPAFAGLGDVLVHGADILRPLGQEFEVSPLEVVPILDVYSGLFGRLAFHAAPARGRRLAATDADWAKGKGDQINGRAIDLMLLLANRRQVKPWLEGPGVAAL
jgi:uncharacterized protein (TIGR03083 family)